MKLNGCTATGIAGMDPALACQVHQNKQVSYGNKTH